MSIKMNACILGYCRTQSTDLGVRQRDHGFEASLDYTARHSPSSKGLGLVAHTFNPNTQEAGGSL